MSPEEIRNRYGCFIRRFTPTVASGGTQAILSFQIAEHRVSEWPVYKLENVGLIHLHGIADIIGVHIISGGKVMKKSILAMMTAAAVVLAVCGGSGASTSGSDAGSTKAAAEEL